MSKNVEDLSVSPNQTQEVQLFAPTLQPRFVNELPLPQHIRQQAWSFRFPATFLAALSGDRIRIPAIFYAVTRTFVRFGEQYVPDPFVMAVFLTLLTCTMAFLYTASSAGQILDAWYSGLWSIMPFAMQMALILCTGVALARAPIVKKLLNLLAGIPSHQTSAAIIVFLAAAVGCWFHWGFGLVVGALLAREIAKRLREVDFSFLVAAAYMGFMVWASGLSSSIALAIATQGSQLNFIERIKGYPIGFDQTTFTAFNLVPVGLLLLLVPSALACMAPSSAEMKRVDPDIIVGQDSADEAEWIARSKRTTFASRLENAWYITAALVLIGVAFASHVVWNRGFALDLNVFIFAAFMLGLALHGRPIRYVLAFYGAARTVGPILLQFPIYGGIMGVMAGTGLAGVIAVTLFGFATPGTLAFWSFLSSCIVSLFVPSGGGQWAVVGPFVVPAAIRLNAHAGMVAMGTAMGVETASMIQPFWALPVLALARLGIRDIMGYCIIAFLIAGTTFGGALLIFGR